MDSMYDVLLQLPLFQGVKSHENVGNHRKDPFSFLKISR